MILQALVDRYNELAAQGKIAEPGWAPAKISWALEIDGEGNLLRVMPLRQASEDGKKLLPREMNLPVTLKSTSGIAANFLWDNSSYILGIDKKGKEDRTAKSFAAAKKLHQELLGPAECPAARAVVSFFEHWDPKNADTSPGFDQYKEDMIAGENICFFFDGAYVGESPAVRAAWQSYYDSDKEGDKEQCLVTGEQTVPEYKHPKIKGVRGAQPSGASLVSFNAEAFYSYGKEQSNNAPVSKFAAFAYTSALNQLLSDQTHRKVIGDTTVVYWAKGAGKQYQDAIAALLDRSDDVPDDILDSLMDAVASGKPFDFNGLPLDPENDFFILGLSPNAGRISVRFFYRRSFGNIVQNLKRHYEDIQIVSDGRSKWSAIPLWALLRETVNQKSSDKNPLPHLAGDVMKSMLDGSRYPETLINQTLLRIRAEQAEKKITRGRAGIVKAWLIRNTQTHPNREKILEVTKLALNPESDYTPYVLGRLFAVLEEVQRAANRDINATIKDRFFNSACSTPASVYPILMRLSNSHLRKMDTGKGVYWTKQIGELTEKLGTEFPVYLALQEQGAFILGYYHQRQKRFEKKDQTNEEAK